MLLKTLVSVYEIKKEVRFTHLSKFNFFFVFLIVYIQARAPPIDLKKFELIGGI